MPRPGPRPYECVRRAWHSERHQPIRGSLIQEIFRLVNEVHRAATKKNEEWQEKLPVVVLKAEEIMYSKANSVAEYVDLKTLWDRTNDAINTIIRLDESTETGNLLQPCIEAALTLGCISRRSSRSERNNAPGYYLLGSTTEPTCVPPNDLAKTNQTNDAIKMPFMSHFCDFIKCTNVDSTHFGLGSLSASSQTSSFATKKLPELSENMPTSADKTKISRSSNSCSIYPLYYGDHFQCRESEFDISLLSKFHSYSTEPGKVSVMRNLVSLKEQSNKVTPVSIGQALGNSPVIDCDLSLRLGPLIVPCISIENSWPQEAEDVGSNTSREGSKLSDVSAQKDKDFSFLPIVKADDPLDSCSSKLSLEGENLNVEETVRKRKAAFSHPYNIKTQFCWQPKLPFKQFTKRMSDVGL